MTEANFDEVLVVLNVPPGLEEFVVDWLLAREENLGFTSFPVFGHSASHADLSAAEQVTGRQSRQQFQVQRATARLDEFLRDAGQALGSGVHFWAIPLLVGGHFDGPA